MNKFLMITYLSLLTIFLTWDAGLFYTAGSNDPVTMIKAFTFAGFAEVAMILFGRRIALERRIMMKGLLCMITGALFIGTNFAAGFEATKGVRNTQAEVERNQQLAKVIAKQKEEKQVQLQQFGKGKQRLNFAKGVNRSDALADKELELYGQASFAPSTFEVSLFFLLRICLSFCLVYFPSRLNGPHLPDNGSSVEPSKENKRTLLRRLFSKPDNSHQKPIDDDGQSTQSVIDGAVIKEDIPVNFYGDTPVLLSSFTQLRNVKGRPASKAKLTLLADQKAMEEGRQYLAAQGDRKGLIRKIEQKVEMYIAKKWKALPKLKAETLLQQGQIFNIEER